MGDLMGIINLNESEEYLGDLSRLRPLAAVPFAGRYRLIDFVLSNMVNSGITNVGICIQHKYRSLMDHLRSGKEWDLARKRDGLFILPSAYTRNAMQIYRGDVENFYSNLDYIYKCRQKYVVIAGPEMVTNLDYREALNFHKKSGAEITALYTKANCSTHDCVRATVLEVEGNGRVIDMTEYDETGEIQKISMKTFIMERSIFIGLVKDCISRGDYDFMKHCIVKNISKYKVYGYYHQGYVARISSIPSYFKHSMELLNPEIRQELFFKSGLIYTKVKDEPPAKYMADANVSNAMVATGCQIAGRVENSILFRGVKVHKGAYIKNSIIMQNGEVGAGAVLENVICDKDVCITANKQLKGECDYPLIIKKGQVI